MPRLYRESPLNSIWEGSGNVQCLDVLRAMVRGPEALEAFFAEVGEAAGADRRLDAAAAELRARARRPRGDRVARAARGRADGARASGLAARPLRRPGGRRRVLRLAARRRLGPGVRHAAGRHRLRADHRAPRGVLVDSDALRAHPPPPAEPRRRLRRAVRRAQRHRDRAAGQEQGEVERHRPQRGRWARRSPTDAVGKAKIRDGAVSASKLGPRRGARRGARRRRRDHAEARRGLGHPRQDRPGDDQRRQDRQRRDRLGQGRRRLPARRGLRAGSAQRRVRARRRTATFTIRACRVVCSSPRPSSRTAPRSPCADDYTVEVERQPPSPGADRLRGRRRPASSSSP